MTDDRILETTRIVVVGAGQAGFSVCAKLRELGHAGPITLVGDEAHPPYQRPPLSKAYLLGETTEERLYFRPLEFYAERKIDLRLRAVAMRVDRTAREIELAGGTRLPYDRLVLCTGSRPRKLPADIGGGLKGVHYVRNLSDINEMKDGMLQGRRVLIVGGGYIGLEAAAVSAKLGLAVTLIEATPRILQRVACSETAAYFRALHADRGIRLLEGIGLRTLVGVDGQVSGAELTDGTYLDVDFVIAGIGVHPNSELAEMAGLVIDNGIAVDVHCRTSDPVVFAAGDCTSFPWKTTRLRLESVGHAIDQADAVAKTIMGISTGYEAMPWFWSDQFDVKLQIAGLSSGYDRVIARSGAADAVSFWYYRGDQLIAVDAMNDPRVYMVAKRLIEAGKSPAPGLVSDPGTDVKTLLNA